MPWKVCWESESDVELRQIAAANLLRGYLLLHHLEELDGDIKPKKVFVLGARIQDGKLYHWIEPDYEEAFEPPQ
jgi:hypothetical protein